ncbi:AI-2E family transporter [Serinibacter arcticus]|uniref:AI-2E family transporter n=1 Tax=Serinibacter arcticus TaxID=1655435 RepID=A0A2U1ZZY0_9MICO|nr:AI-2E family transporter [Serinibacter arcticus]PWD52472.1 AI-2E family transporter [Serinibacter arcticus]
MLTILLGLAAGVVALAGLYLGREVVGPLLLGAVIVIICHPVRHRFDRRGLPTWVGTTVVITLAYVILAVLALLLSWAGIEFVDLVIEYTDELQDSAAGLLAWLESIGLEAQIADAAASVLDPATIMGWARSLGGAVLGVLTGFFLVLAYVIFMAADGGRYTGAERTFGASRTATVDRFRRYNASVRKYFTVNATFGAIVAVIDGLALWWLGVPAPAVWAVLAFVTNFIPNIGFILGLVPPMVLALMIGGWPLMLIVAVVYSVVNVVLQVLVQPKFVSDAVSLSLTLSFFSVLFWTFVIGPLGAILAIPLTLLVRALVLEGDPGTAWLRWLTGDRSTEPARLAAPEPDPEGEEEPTTSRDGDAPAPATT